MVDEAAIMTERLAALRAGALLTDVFKHTPGPWFATESWHPPLGCLAQNHEGDKRNTNGDVFWGYAIHGRDRNGASLAAVHNFPTDIHHNAKLIAAAPDLLAALSALCDAWDDPHHIRGGGGGTFRGNVTNAYNVARHVIGLAL